MITVEGAGVIATVVPIGLLIIGFEIQRVPQFVATTRSGTATLWLTGIHLFVALVLGFYAEWRLIECVATGVEMDRVSATFVWVALWLIGSGSLLLLMGSLADRLGLLERLGRRAIERTRRSPRRSARQRAYVDEHHPSPPRV